ncbi:MAG TPA: asparagine synthase (glutamine-hydrolyzing) [Ohtaekwangia sp.]|nr:asparagine synthase (glutamine-hydrolyzing) [Ohtaekwangia sp.]
MCGITGIFAFNLIGKVHKIHVTNATQAISKRGPDFQDIHLEEWVALGHRRLSIIDTSSHANQPMWDESGRYCIVFNGEIFNYRELRKELTDRGVTFFSQGDTEVLLKLFIHQREKCLPRLNGFFTFCIYDKAEQTLFVARDRFGIKPLYYCFDEDKFIFASEMKAMMQYGIEKKLDIDSLLMYFQLNYIPGPDSVFTNIKKLLPGHYLVVKRQEIAHVQYYDIPHNPDDVKRNMSYEDACREFARLLEQAVQRRLVADVPLGAFLSGGIDSSVITGLAARYKPDIHTFSIGFRDEKFFDETHYAEMVAKHFRTRHTVFSLSNDDLYAHVEDVIKYIDEPFADSSALAVYILSRETRKHATVALSGDGADEMLGGYNKHAAFYRMLHPGWKEKAVSALGPLWSALPQSRSSAVGNRIRQLNRFSRGSRLNTKERYWQWAGFVGEDEVTDLFTDQILKARSGSYIERKSKLLETLSDKGDMNDVFLTDMKVVLANDMLTKVDLMSMANSLEVRPPFLDFEVVNFVFSLPAEFKINGKMRKRILQDSYREMLPKALYNRPKKGFEVPLLKWFRREMKTMIMEDVLDDTFIREQGIFKPEKIAALRNQLFSANPGDIHARIWAFIVFQRWWKRTFQS